MNPGPRTAIVIGFTPLERAGLALMFEDHRIALAGVCDSFAEVAAAPAFDTLVVDLAAFPPEDAAGLERLAADIVAVRAQRPGTHVLGVQKRFSHTIAALHRAGLDASVDLGSDTEALIAAVLGPPAAPSERPHVDAPLVLSDTERTVLQRIAGGATSRAIGELLGVSVHAVESHKHRLFRRLGAQNQAQAVAIAMRLGLIDRASARGAAS